MIDCHAVTEYKFTASDRLFLDTNIWVYCLASHLRSQEHGEKIAAYSQALLRAKNTKSTIFTNLPAIVEFINCYAQESFKQWKLSVKGSNDEEIKSIVKGNFKKFRRSQYFKPFAIKIKDKIVELLEDMSDIYVGDKLSTSDIARFMENYATGTIDFNDLVFVELCKQKNLILMTDDADFKCHDVTILTANECLLRDTSATKTRKN